VIAVRTRLTPPGHRWRLGLWCEPPRMPKPGAWQGTPRFPAITISTSWPVGTPGVPSTQLIPCDSDRSEQANP
jgi:hypothetical protein